MKLRILHLEDDAADSELIRLSLERGGLDCNLLTVNNFTLTDRSRAASRPALIGSEVSTRNPHHTARARLRSCTTHAHSFLRLLFKLSLPFGRRVVVQSPPPLCVCRASLAQGRRS